MKNAFLLFILVLSSSVLFGQGYLFNSQEPTYSLDSLEFRFLCSDPEGLIYIGTNKGLLFYDGYEARSVVEGDFSAGFHSGSEIVLGDENGVLYTASGSGFRILSSGPVADSSAISDILVLDGKKYVATEGEGLIVLGKNEQKRVSTENGLLNDDFVYQVEIFENDVWVATDRGVDRFWPSMEKKDHYASPGLTRSFTQSSQGLISAGYSTGLSRFVPDSGFVKTVNKRRGIDKIIAVNGELFALENGSLSYLDSEVWKVIGGRSDIVDVIQTRHGNLITLHEDGEMGFADLKFLHFDLEFSEEVTALYNSPKELFAASRGKIYRIDLRTGEQSSTIYLGEEMVVVDLITIGDRLYCATFNRGLIEINLSTGEKSFVKGLPDQSVLSLAAGENGDLWVSTLSGLSKYISGKDAISVDLGREFPSTYIYKLFLQNDYLWLGTDGSGVFRYQNEEIEQISTVADASKNSVYDIASDRSGRIYAMSLELGVLVYDEESARFKTQGFFGAKDYNSFGVTAEGECILCTETAIHMAGSNLERQFIESYFPTQLSGAFMHTFSEWTEPWLYFASGNAVYAYRSREEMTEAPSVLLRGWEVNYSERSLEETNLSAGEENCVFRFATTSYSDPKNQQIEVRLKGYETKFRTISSREITYPKLPPGKYTLEARLSENGMTYPQTHQLLQFKIAIPIYFQWWFILLCLGLLTLITFLIFQSRVNRLTKSRLAEKKLLESELALLRNQVNPHFLFNSFNTLMNLIEQEPKEANEYLQRLSDFYRRMLEKNEDQVVTLSEELVLAREYCYLQKKRFGEAFNFYEKIEENLGKSYVPVLTLQLLIENAIKHNVISRAKPLEIILENKAGHLCLKNKIASKREPAEGTGLGLENIRKRYNSIFELDITVEEKNGWFEVYLPIVN